MTNPTFWNQFLIWPITNILMAFYKLFEFLHIPGPLGWAVIFMTLFMRLLLYPLMQAQLKSARKMALLKPHLDAINSQHKGNKQALQQAQLDLYKQHGVNPAAGCLPLLVQMPILIALYNVFYHVLSNTDMAVVVKDINAIVYTPLLKVSSIDLTFFGTNLAVKPSSWQTDGWWLLSIPVITGLLQYWQSKLMQPVAAIAPVTKPKVEKQTSKAIRTDVAVKDEKKPEDTAAEMQKQMMIISPLMFGFFAFQFPLGLALYWNVFGLFGIMQQLQINKAK